MKRVIISSEQLKDTEILRCEGNATSYSDVLWLVPNGKSFCALPEEAYDFIRRIKVFQAGRPLGDVRYIDNAGDMLILHIADSDGMLHSKKLRLPLAFNDEIMLEANFDEDFVYGEKEKEQLVQMLYACGWNANED